MPSSRIKGSSPFRQLLKTRDTPDEGTGDWRAVCGKTARTVRRAGRVDTLPDPYRPLLRSPVSDADIGGAFRGCPAMMR